MTRTEARVSELVRWNAKKGGRYVQAIGLDLTKEVENRVGKVYAIMMVDAPARVGEALFAHIDDAFGRGVLEALRKGGPEASHEHVFEIAIAHVNHAVSRMFGEHGFGIEPEYVSAALLSLRENDVVAAVWGRPSLLLFHASQGRAAKILDLVDESESAPPPFRTAPLRRCFGSVISGRIGMNDRLLLATQDLRDLLGEDELETYASATDHATATALIKERLSPATDNVSVAALVLDIAQVRYVEDAVNSAPATTQSSLANLRMLESHTREVMSPSPLAAIQKKVFAAAGAANESLQQVFSKKKKTEQTSTRASVAHPSEKKPILTLCISFVKDVAHRTQQVTLATIRVLRSKDERARVTTTVVSRFNELSPSSRYLFFSALFLIASFNTSVLVGSWQRSYTALTASAEERYTVIGENIDNAESSIVYKDEEQARQLLAKATAAITALPAKKSKEKAKKAVLEKRAEEVRTELRPLVQLAPPTVVGAIPEENASIVKLAAADGGMTWSASSNGDIFRSVTTGAAMKKIGTVPGEKIPTVFTVNDTHVLAASNVGDAVIIDSDGKLVDKKIEQDPQGSAITDAQLYNGRLYVLDAAHNRILRQSPNDAGFSKPQFYLKDGTDVSRGTSIAIDSAIYILNNDGSILRIMRGAQEPFGVVAADPPVSAAKRLRVADDLYVLDSAPARIIRYNKKTGALVAQYVSPSLEGATDFTFDTKMHTALVSVKNQLLQFSLPK